MKGTSDPNAVVTVKATEVADSAIAKVFAFFQNAIAAPELVVTADDEGNWEVIFEEVEVGQYSVFADDGRTNDTTTFQVVEAAVDADATDADATDADATDADATDADATDADATDAMLTLPMLTLPMLTLPMLTLPMLTLPMLTLPMLTLPMLAITTATIRARTILRTIPRRTSWPTPAQTLHW
ncbi:hypothetical protein [Arthrobacter sp. JUb115]|uniref:hypothetical protein n=1 Tax=Arthrobacter sp. JUb115 TaxID=2485108 RepID=UPI001AAFF1A3|nr:hypothetical protein [Arthrobacter sp. JUb115]